MDEVRLNDTVTNKLGLFFLLLANRSILFTVYEEGGIEGLTA